MRILVIAYEYPPTIAAQSLRWFYLANELAALGVEVEVLTTSIRDIWRAGGQVRPDIRVHRCFPGPFIALAGRLSARWYRPGAASAARSPLSSSSPGLAVRAYRGLRVLLNHLFFPDVRSEWLPFAGYALTKLLNRKRYDVLISAHEPGVDLILGYWAQRRWRLPWLVDLGDPLLTPYTPAWRRWLDSRFENAVCRRADRIVVTVHTAAERLSARHGLAVNRFAVIPQGFAEQPSPAETVLALPQGRFVLLYTGSFYKAFRDPGELIAALLQLPQLIWVVAGHLGDCAEQFRPLGDRVVLLGERDHLECLALQRRATVLLNLGNRQAYQVPGKLFEYLGAGRPILHVSSTAADPALDVLAATGRGLAVINRRKPIAEALHRLYRQWRDAQLDGSFDLSPQAVQAYSWTNAARRFQALCEHLSVQR